MRFDAKAARVKLQTALAEVKPVEERFSPEEHRLIFSGQEGEPDARVLGRALKKYYKTARIDLTDPRVLPKTPEELFRSSVGQCVLSHSLTPATMKRIGRVYYGATDWYKQAIVQAAVKALRENHGQTMLEVLKNTRRSLREVDVHDRELTTKPEKEMAEIAIELKKATYAGLLHEIFKNTLLIHWEAVNHRELPPDYRWLVAENLGLNESWRDNPRKFAMQVDALVSDLDKKKGEEVEELAKRTVEINQKLAWYVLTDAERAKIRGKSLEAAQRGEDFERQLEKDALSLHNRQLKKLALQEPYKSLSVWSEVHKIKGETAQRHLMFELVHSMTEGLPAEDVKAIIERELEKEKPKETGSAQERIPKVEPQKRDFSEFLSQFGLSTSENKKLSAKLNAIRGRVRGHYFDTEFLPSLKARLSPTPNVGEIAAAIEEERKKLYERPEKMTVQPEKTSETPAPQVTTVKGIRSLKEILSEIDELVGRKQGFVTKGHITELKQAAKREIETAKPNDLQKTAEHLILALLSAGAGEGRIHEFARQLPEFLDVEAACDSLKKQGKLEVKRRIWTIDPDWRGKYRIARK